MHPSRKKSTIMILTVFMLQQKPSTWSILGPYSGGTTWNSGACSSIDCMSCLWLPQKHGRPLNMCLFFWRVTLRKLAMLVSFIFGSRVRSLVQKKSSSYLPLRLSNFGAKVTQNPQHFILGLPFLNELETRSCFLLHCEIRSRYASEVPADH